MRNSRNISRRLPPTDERLNSQINERERYRNRERERERERLIRFFRREAEAFCFSAMQRRTRFRKREKAEKEREYRNFRCSLRSLSRGPLVISLRNMTAPSGVSSRGKYIGSFLARARMRRETATVSSCKVNFPLWRFSATRCGTHILIRGSPATRACPCPR